jgi:hypothetical protein
MLNFNYQEWLAQQNKQPSLTQSPQNQTPMPAPQAPQMPQERDLALQAMLGIEKLSPKARQMERKRAQIQQLRDMALGSNARHWTGVLAQGLAGGLSGYQGMKLDPEEEALNEERRKMMEQLGLGL